MSREIPEKEKGLNAGHIYSLASVLYKNKMKNYKKALCVDARMAAYKLGRHKVDYSTIGNNYMRTKLQWFDAVKLDTNQKVKS